MQENIVFNGDFTVLPPDPLTLTNTGLRWINGTGSGAYSDQGYGWYMDDKNLKGSSAGFVRAGYHYGGGGIVVKNRTEAGKTIVTSRKLIAKPNTAYKLTFYVETENVPDNGVAIKVNYFASGATVANFSATSERVSGNNTCKFIELTFTTWPSTVKIQLELQNNVVGAISSATFHDIKIVENKSLVTTPLNIASQYGTNVPFAPEIGSWKDADFRTFCEQMRTLGLTWIRASFVWSSIKPTGSTTYNFVTYDRFVQIANSCGLQVVPILTYDGGKLHTEEFSEYFTAISSHYRQYGIRYYELWNEKNLFIANFNNNNPHYYAEILKQAYPALKEGDPTCKVLFSGLTCTTIGQTAIQDTTAVEYSASDYLQSVYSEGAGNCFDIMNLHPYGHVEGVIQAVRQVMFNNGDEIKPLWFTEDGIPTGGTGGQLFTDQAGQSAYLLAAIELAKKYSVSHLFFYNGSDSNEKKPDREGYFGIMSGPLTALVPKQSYAAIRNTINPPVA